MTFENDLAPEPTMRSQFIAHLPIVLLVLGVGGAFLALHAALAGVVALFLLHAVAGGLIMAVRRHRSGSNAA